MGDPRPPDIWRLFLEAAEMSAIERSAFLAAACGDDDQLRTQVRRLLAADEATDGLLDRSGPILPEGEDLRDPLLGERVDSYRILKVLGEGGMGVVYEAQQDEPVSRRVALKVIRPGMDTREVVRRFDTERRALALMSHPAIAQVFDGGSTEAGRLYFAMELVDGVPINEFCDAARLKVTARLELFRQVCEGVRHAHQKGILHRDLKPTNVLVSEPDSRPTPKIIDFGIAKAVSGGLADRTARTVLGGFIGTPDYMSPEQIDATIDDVDTRSDVYSLGVILHELLVGMLPFDPEALRAAGPTEMRRRIRHDDPPTLSRRLATSEKSRVEEIAAARGSDARRFQRRLRGELEWIVARALERERDRRYRSVGELIDDVTRFLRNEPVTAGPPTATYRARKFLRRHAVAAGFTTLVASFILVLLVTTMIQARRLAVEANTAQEVSNLLAAVFEVSNPDKSRGETLTARQVLDSGAQEIAARLGDQPIVQARLLETIGNVYRSLGHYDAAEPLLQTSWELRRDELGEDHPDTLSSLEKLGQLAWDQENLERAESLNRSLLEGTLRTFGELHPATASAANNYGLVLLDLGRLEEAESLLRRALDLRSGAFGEDHSETLGTLGNLGAILLAQNDLEEAEPLLRRQHEGLARILGEDHPSTLIALNDLGDVLKRQRRFDEAEPILRNAVEGHRRVLGEDHRETLTSMSNLGNLLLISGRLEEAEPVLVETLERRKRTLGQDAPGTLISANDFGVLSYRLGNFIEAEASFRRVLEGNRRVLGDEHRETVTATYNLGSLLALRGRLAEAEPLVVKAYEARVRLFGEDNPLTLSAGARLGNLLAGLGRYAEAEPVLLRVHEYRRDSLGEDHAATRKASEDLVEMYTSWGRPERAAVFANSQPSG